MTTNIFLFLVLANAATGFFAAAGVWEDMGVQYDTDYGEKFDNVMEDINELARKATTGGAIGGTLVDMITNTLGFVQGMGAVVLFGTGKLLSSFGAPDFIVTPLNAVLPVIVAKDVVAHLLRFKA
jgi:hypothetical protein